MRKLLIAISCAIALFVGTKSYAQSDTEQVKAVVGAYHEALTELDTAKMEALWAHDDAVMLVNPGSKSISVGWEAVKRGWEGTFAAFSKLKVAQSDGPHVQVKGDVAWSTGIVNVAEKAKSGFALNAPIFEMDVFEKRGSKWLLVSHTALAMRQ